MKQYKQKNGHIMDEEGTTVAHVLASNCGRKMRDKIAKYAVEKLNCEERGKAAAKAYREVR